ncbi:cyclophilin-like fold protein [Exiguobacterium sp. K1]|uniref:cyclophilin-like fold protein n=1 Tax=Exiguobacterium sp. K1 TaxID=2980105 RepID=UPI00299E28F5|nr:cyclophilin-like fold protein [Exiguobacterium sp. K1]MDX1258812.1 cyclophilin-like fold protein [Exiguobacterium sp. K1]
MKRRVGAAIVLLSLVLVGCGPAVPVSTEIKQEVEENDTMNININGQVASVQLEDNTTTKAILANMPFTIQMDDLHQNEKYHYFDKSFPTQPQPIQTIEAGDVLLYQNNCLVIFYQAAEPVVPYTRIGKISRFQDIRASFGNKSVSVQWYEGEGGE